MFFNAKSKSCYNADLCKFSEWLNEVAYVHDATKQCPLKDGEHKIRMCSKLKQQAVNNDFLQLLPISIRNETY